MVQGSRLLILVRLGSNPHRGARCAALLLLARFNGVAYYRYTQLTRNVRLSHPRIATFSAHRDVFDYIVL